MDPTAPGPSPSLLTNDVPTVVTIPPLTTVVESTPAPSLAEAEDVDDSPNPDPDYPLTHHQPSALIPALLISIFTFSAGLGGTIGYYKYFNDSIPLPPQDTQGMLLGLSTTVPTPPPATPTPDMTLKPEILDKPLEGSLAYIKDNQIYVSKADRTSVNKLTEDENQKTEIAVSPDSKFLYYLYLTTTDQRDDIAGLNQIDLKTKTLTEIVKPDKYTYSHLKVSPDGNYASLWVNHGLEAKVIDLNSGETTVQFGTPDPSGITPIIFLPNNRLSFILKNELFSSDINGATLKSHALEVSGLIPQTDTTNDVLGPLWSSTGKYAAVVRLNGIFLIDTQQNQEIVIINQEKPLVKPTEIPWRLLSFTSNDSHLIYEDRSQKDGQTTGVYSLFEKKNVPITDVTSPLLASKLNLLLGFPPEGSGEDTLEKYSLETWDQTVCPASDFRYRPPSVIPVIGTHPVISPDGTGLIGYAKSPKPVTTVKLLNLETCVTYDLVKTTEPGPILWIP